MKLTAVRSVKYGGKTYAKGETFEAADKWGRVLTLLGRAKRSEGGDEFGIVKPKKEKPAFKDFTPAPAAKKPAEPTTTKQAARRAVITTGKKPAEPLMSNAEFARQYQTRDMGTQPTSKPAAEPVKVEDLEADQVVKPHEKPAE